MLQWLNVCACFYSKCYRVFFDLGVLMVLCDVLTSPRRPPLAVISQMKYHPSFVYEDGDDASSTGCQARKSTGVLSTPAMASKMSLTDTAEEGSLDDDQEISFHNRRRQMKFIFDVITLLDEPMVTEYVTSMLAYVVKEYKTLPFIDVEMALFMVFNYGEAVKSVAFVHGTPPVLTALAQLVLQLLQNTGNFACFCDHGVVVVKLKPTLNLEDLTRLQKYPVIPLMYMETIVRYASIFSERLPEGTSALAYLPSVLEPMIDNRGAHHPIASIQQRIWYLLLKFIKALPCNRQDKTDERDAMMKSAVACLGDLLIISPQSGPVNFETSPRIDALLSLFEAVGAMAASIREPSMRMEVLVV